MMSTITKTRAVKKLEKPRPLKSIGTNHRSSFIDTNNISVEEIMDLADTVSVNLSNGNYDSVLQHNIITLSGNLKLYGHKLETVYKDQLDRLFVTFRNGCSDDRLDGLSKLHLLELTELRASNWQSCENINNYYKLKLELLPVPNTPTQINLMTPVSPSPVSPVMPQMPILGPGDIIKNSGKYNKPTKIPGKNYFKDEVVIRNSDSGKVMGIKGRRVHMIEELSETIISFQRVAPGAKERLVQITGPNEERIIHAKNLIEDTIHRNASPIRPEFHELERVGGSSSSLSSTSDDSSRFPQGPHQLNPGLKHSLSTSDANADVLYSHTVTVGNSKLKITGSEHYLVWTAKLVLEEHFAGVEEPFTLLEPYNYLGGGEIQTNEDAVLHSKSSTQNSVMPIKINPANSILNTEPYIDLSSISSGQPTVIRQSLTSETSHDIFRQSESSAKIETILRTRRDFITRPNSQLPLKEEEEKYGCSKSKIVYTTNELALFALSKSSVAVPKDWKTIVEKFPSIVKEVIEYFDPNTYKKWKTLNPTVPEAKESQLDTE